MKRQRQKLPTRTLWIICEGLTEKNYFNQLKAIERISRVKVLTAGKNTDALGIMKYAIACMQSNPDFEKGDSVFCVFDRDSNTDIQLKKTKELAKKHRIQIAFSNPCFEYWLLIHYCYHPNSCEVADLPASLQQHITSYSKNDPDIYKKTFGQIDTATKNSKRKVLEHTKSGTEHISRQSNPITLVHQIIDETKHFK